MARSLTALPWVVWWEALIDYAIRSNLWPKLAKFLPAHPKLNVELINEYESVDIAARGYDAGVRFGQELAKDMI